MTGFFVADDAVFFRSLATMSNAHGTLAVADRKSIGSHNRKILINALLDGIDGGEYTHQSRDTDSNDEHR